MPLHHVEGVSAGVYHTCAWTTDGTAWCWGDNTAGQLGGGTTTTQSSPVQVLAGDGKPLTGVIRMSTGYEHSCAVSADGAAWCWGDNGAGQLGDATTTDRLGAVPVTVRGGAALTSDGTAWCWVRTRTPSSAMRRCAAGRGRLRSSGRGVGDSPVSPPCVQASRIRARVRRAAPPGAARCGARLGDRARRRHRGPGRPAPGPAPDADLGSRARRWPATLPSCAPPLIPRPGASLRRR